MSQHLNQIANNDPVLLAALQQADNAWADINLAIQHGLRVLLWGPPGTGKSYAGLTNIPGRTETTVDPALVNRQYITMDTPSSEIRGHYVPNSDGGFRWHDGPATTAWRNGTRLCIEEIDAASGDCLTLLLGYLDDPESAVLTLPSNETLRPADGFTCVATTNQLPTVLQPALLDRFDAVLHVEKPNPAAFGGVWHSDVLCMVAARTFFLKGTTPPRCADGRVLGLRSFRAIDRYLGRGVPFAKSCQLVVGNEAGVWLAAACGLSAE